MNFTELKARLRKSVKNPDLTELPDADAGEYVNSGYRDVTGRYPFHQTRKRCTFNTIIGEEKYQMPDDIAAILRLKIVDTGKKLWKAGDRLIADRLTDGFRSDPQKYVRYRNYVELAPTPSRVQTIEIYYRAIQALLSDANPNPVLPLEWHDGIWMRGRWYYWMDKGDTAQKASADADYKLWLSDKAGEIDEESVDIDSGVELPELTRGYRPASLRWDDGYFDYRN